MLKKQISASIFLDIIQGLCQLGFQRDQLLQAMQLEPSLLQDPDTLIDATPFYRLWDYAIATTGQPSLPLQLGAMSEPGNYGIVGHIAMTSATIRGCYLHFQRYSRLLCSMGEVLHHEQDGLFKFIFHYYGDPHYHHCFAAKVTANMITMGRAYLGETVHPQYVRFQGKPPADLTPYQQLFRCPIQFNADEDCMVVRSAEVDTVCKREDNYLAKLLRQHAETLLSQLEQTQTLSGKVQTLLIEHLPKGEADIERIAATLCMSRWTLNRRLKEENTSYQQLLEQTRKQMAQDYLKQNLTITEVAFMLGFSEPSAFNRAFKRWAGEAPGAYRQNSQLAS